jgi:hypothetical protein
MALFSSWVEAASSSTPHLLYYGRFPSLGHLLRAFPRPAFVRAAASAARPMADDKLQLSRAAAHSSTNTAKNAPRSQSRAPHFIRSNKLKYYRKMCHSPGLEMSPSFQIVATGEELTTAY